MAIRVFVVPATILLAIAQGGFGQALSSDLCSADYLKARQGKLLSALQDERRAEHSENSERAQSEVSASLAEVYAAWQAEYESLTSQPPHNVQRINEARAEARREKYRVIQESREKYNVRRQAIEKEYRARHHMIKNRYRKHAVMQKAVCLYANLKALKSSLGPIGKSAKIAIAHNAAIEKAMDTYGLTRKEALNYVNSMMEGGSFFPFPSPGPEEASSPAEMRSYEQRQQEFEKDKLYKTPGCWFC